MFILDSLGTWYGLLGQKSERTWPIGPMFSVEIHASSSVVNGFEAIGSMPDSMRGIVFTLRGSTETTPGGELVYVLDLRFTVLAILIQLHGRMHENGTSISGDWGGQGMSTDTDHQEVGPFILTRLPPDVLSFRPAPWELESKSDRIRALWRFALSAVEYRVLQSTYSWKFFKQRRDVRRRYVEFCIRQHFGRPLGASEKIECRGLERTLSPLDARYYASLAEYHILQADAVHVYVILHRPLRSANRV